MIKYLRYKLWLWITQHRKDLRAGGKLTDPSGQQYEIVEYNNNNGDGGSFIDLEAD